MNFSWYKIMILIYLLILFIICVYVHVFIHEAGHLLFGICTGYKFSSFRIGTYLFIKKKDNISINKYKLAGTLGQCLLTPPEYNNGDMPCILYNIGGLVFSAIATILSAVAWFLLPDINYVKAFITLFFTIGIAFLLMNAIPMNIEGNSNDAQNIKDLLKNPYAKREMYVELTIISNWVKGIQLKDMEDSLFLMPEQADLSDRFNAQIYRFIAMRHLNNQDFIQAKKCFQEILNHKPPISNYELQSIQGNLLFLAMLLDCNSQKDEAAYSDEIAKCLKRIANSVEGYKVAYAYTLLIEKNLEKATEIKNNAKMCLASYALQGEAIAEMDLINSLKANNTF
jgi:tetratricopeptide (TPR) repeat protein